MKARLLIEHTSRALDWREHSVGGKTMLLAAIPQPRDDHYARWRFIGVDGQLPDRHLKDHPAASPPKLATFRRIRISDDPRPPTDPPKTPSGYFLAFKGGAWGIVRRCPQDRKT